MPLLAVLATDAAAQTDSVLISNLGKGNSSNTGQSLRLFDQAQAFTTGSHSGGYTVSSADVQFTLLDSTAFSKMTVSIQSDSNGPSGTIVGSALTNPSYQGGSNRVHNFAAPGAGIDLAASTTYWLVIDVDATNRIGTGGNEIGVTSSNDEDAGGASGWSIGNEGHHRNSDSSGSWTTRSQTKKIRINGMAKTVTSTGSLTFNPTSVAVTEGGDAMYTVRLATLPTGTVTVTPSSNNGDVTFAPPSLTFTTGNWSQPQTVTVSAAEDTDTANDAATISHTASGGGYDSVTGNVPVTVTDNDTPGLTFTPTSVAVTEGATANYTVRLATLPTGTVTVTPSSDNGDVTFAPPSLTFTTGNWSQPQTVTVTAAEDTDTANDAATLSHTASGGGYGSVTGDIGVTVTDNDTANLTFTPTSVAVTEGATANYTVRLATLPTGTVTVTPSSDNGDVTFAPNTLTFTTGNWSSPQTVTVTAGEDNDAANDAATLSHTASGGGYGSVTGDIGVTVTDNDTANLTFTPTSVAVTEGATANYTVRLATLPTGTVTVTPSSDNGDVTFAPASLTFTTGNWSSPQTVTVTAGEDNDAANDAATLSHTASGGGYDSVTGNVPVTVTDNDTANLTFTPTSVAVTEGGDATYTVRLATLPTGTVTVTPSSNNGDVTFAPASLTFTTGNWSTPQAVTVSAAEDTDTASDAATISHTASGGGYGSVTGNVGVTVTDNDTANLTFTPTSVGVTEGGDATYTVRLATLPTGTVTVTPSSNNGDVTFAPASLTFTTGNWSTPQAVTVSAAEDTDMANDAATISHTASGGGYGSVTGNVPVTVADNDTANLTFTPTSVAVTEGGDATYTVRLATLPTGTVTVTPSSNNGDVTFAPASLTFTTGNWSQPQTVTVSAAEDNDAANDAATISHTASGGGYGSVTGNVPVTVADNDTPAPDPTTPAPDPTLTVTVSCVPCAVPLGGSVRLTATAFPAYGDLLIWRWSAARGVFSEPEDEPSAIWTAPTDLARDVARHEIRVDVSDGRGGGASATVEIAVTGPEAVWYLPPMSDPVRQGFVRVLNHSDVAGAATVTATDDAGVEHGPLTLALGPRQVAAFNSDDLESGNEAKGLRGATGAGTGGWRLAVESDDLDVEALAYMRTVDGFVTGMNAVAPREDDVLEIATFNPGSNVDQVSLLRLVNPTAAEATATVAGVDDAGLSPGQPVLLTLPAGSACTVDAAQLESGAGLACGAPQEGLGDGTGKWRLTVASDAALVAMSLLSSPAGHLTNLSGKAARDGDGIWNVDLFPAASDPLGRQGFLRMTSGANWAGFATILAHDDSNARYEPLRLHLGAGESVHLNSDDLELGNRAKGLTGSTGSGRGNWRLRIYPNLGLDANAYVRTGDGVLTAMQARAPRAGAVHRVAFFNPGSNKGQVSVLRLVNHSSSDAEVSIDGTDDLGLRPGSTVQVLVPATDALELTAVELESGEADAIMSGALGDGAGKWRLRVESNRIAAVLSLLSSPGGHLTNLSYADGERGLGPLPAALLPAPETVTLESPASRELRGRWSAVEGARYDVELMRDGVADEDRSLTQARNTTLTFRWANLRPGTYATRARSVNEDRMGGPWRVSEEVVID